MKRLIFVILVSALAFVADQFIQIPVAPELITIGSVIGALITGAGVKTTFAGQSQCESFIVIGDPDDANVLRALSVEIDGTPFININSAALMNAFQKWQNMALAGAVGLTLKIATGQIKRNTTYSFTNDGATTPNVRVFSTAKDGVPIVATTKQINALSFDDFDKFSALFLTAPADVTEVELLFTSGHKATMTIQEVDALFAMGNDSEAAGRLGGVSVIDNRGQTVQSVRVFAGANPVTVLVAKLPDAAFKVLTARQ